MRRTAIVAAVLAAVAAAAAGVGVYASRSAKPSQLNYEGQMYSGVVEVSRGRAEAAFGPFRRGRGLLAGKPVYVPPGDPPPAIGLRLPDGHLDTYQLMQM